MTKRISTDHQGDHTDYRQMLGRMLRSYTRRVASSSVEDLAEMMTLREDLETSIQQAVDGLRASGHSWADIARPLGISRQSAQQRYGASFGRDACDVCGSMPHVAYCPKAPAAASV